MKKILVVFFLIALVVGTLTLAKGTSGTPVQPQPEGQPVVEPQPGQPVDDPLDGYPSDETIKNPRGLPHVTMPWQPTIGGMGVFIVAVIVLIAARRVRQPQTA